MAGGAPITIAGSKMGTMPELNTIMLNPTWLEGVELVAPSISCKNIISNLIDYVQLITNLTQMRC